MIHGSSGSAIQVCVFKIGLIDGTTLIREEFGYIFFVLCFLKLKIIALLQKLSLGGYK